ncbi:MAG: DUF4178 domain-containing protein [Deltaproteobacteria bacterium]|nr:DUF4178 domain-containing protein [Deltaproteobacteria bacterium]
MPTPKSMFTALLIAILIVTGAATVVGGGLVLAAARRRELGAGEAPKQLPAAPQSKSGERGFRELRVGDIVQHENEDYLVEGVINFDEDGHRWLGARLTDGENDRWLYVGMERMGSASKRFLDIDDNLELSGFPPEKITIGGTRYALEKRGAATTRLSGDVGSLPGIEGLSPESVFRCRWWRYQGAGSATMVVEQWSGEFRALRGSELTSTDAIEMMPGS